MLRNFVYFTNYYLKSVTLLQHETIAKTNPAKFTIFAPINGKNKWQLSFQ